MNGRTLHGIKWRLLTLGGGLVLLAGALSLYASSRVDLPPRGDVCPSCSGAVHRVVYGLLAWSDDLVHVRNVSLPGVGTWFLMRSRQGEFLAGG